MKKILQLIPSAFMSFALILVVSSAKANEQEAEAFIRNLANQALQILSTADQPLEVREEKLRTLLNDGFAMKFIGRYVVGRYWKKMTGAQKEEYQKLFAEWTLRTYSSRLGGYKNQKFEVIKAVSNGKKDIFVKTRITQPAGGDPIECDWRVRKVNDKYQIVDIGIAGISMLLTQKNEFSSLLSRNGINGLIEMLKARNSKFTAISS